MPKSVLKISDLRAFEEVFDTTREDLALKARGEFIRRFPMKNINNLLLNDYVIGRGTDSFCAWVEPKSRDWAVIQGSTVHKFGVYYGKIKSDQVKRYRYTRKFGGNRTQAFRAVKSALILLITDGRRRDFQAIDANPLSQMLKAKILSLYFPKKYLNVCSAEHIEIISSELGLPERDYISEKQHYLVIEKQKNNITSNWSNPKYTSFLYSKFTNLKRKPSITIKKPRKKTKRKVNFEDIQKRRNEIGRMSEEFALKWEKDRLLGLGYESLIKKVKDRHDRPGYGYDILSYTSSDIERYIEVKTLGYDYKEGCYRFFLSEDEKTISESSQHKKEYYFYMVQYKNKIPCNVIIKKASEIYSIGDISSCAYVVRLDIKIP